MAKVIIKTPKADDPIYKEVVTISSSLGAAMMRAKARYIEQKNVEGSKQQVKDD